jgi:hypothetical protein
MLSLLFGIGYGELTWLGVVQGRNTVKQAKGFAWFMVIVNFILSLVVGSLANLEISIIVLNYVLVIFNLRETKNVKR